MAAPALDLSPAKEGFRGRIFLEDDPAYDEARRTFNALIDRRPVAIARCAATEDVVVAFEIARRHGFPVAVRGGGHNVAGHAVCDGGLVIDLSGLASVEVDADARTASAWGGATWKEFDAATQRFGLAAPGGTFSTTGVGGLTLGGGIGFLIAPYGLTCDNVIGAEVVTTDGRVLHASEDENADLFWALRGGGGNFGVVTRFDFQLRPVRDVVAGLLRYDVAAAPEVIRTFRGIALEAPLSFTTQCFLTADAEGRHSLAVIVCSTAPDPEPAELAALRAAPGLIEDGVGPMPYLELQRTLDMPFGLRNYWKGHFVRELPDELIDDLCERFSAPAYVPGAVLIEAIQGAAKRVPADATAVSFREAQFNVSALAVWADAVLDDAEIEWARAAAAAVAPYSLSGGGYLNYMQHDEPLERVRAAFGPEKFERLREIKRRYDPDNVLCFNQNIPPA